MRTEIAFVVVGLFLLAIPASPVQAQPQWTTPQVTDDFTGETTRFARIQGRNANVVLAVACAGGGYAVLLNLVYGGIFHNGTVEVRWDEGPVERYEFNDGNETLSAWASASAGRGSGYDPRIASFVGKLRRHNDMRIRVTKWEDERLIDSVDLTGSSRAISTLPCS